MPDKPEFAFLKQRGMRIRTIRLRGQVSQGICFPLSILPPDFEVSEDADCTGVLCISKYEPPIPACLSGIMKGKFPSFIPKTDETRVQVLQKLLDKYKGEKCHVTEKVDGSSATFYINNGEFGVCSRNMELLEDDENSFWKVARELDIENKLRSLNGNFAIQGELIGEGIQDNKLKLRGQTMRFFNAFDIDRFEYRGFEKFTTMMQQLELPTVPVISTDYALSNDIDEIIKMATRKSLIYPETWAEGIVIRPVTEKKDLLLNGRVSFKAINPEFLLKYGE
jgi:RNA ligase (TIGR02306 family)